MKGIEFLRDLPNACEGEIVEWLTDEIIQPRHDNRHCPHSGIQDFWNCIARDAPAEEFKKIVMDCAEDLGANDRFHDYLESKYNL